MHKLPMIFCASAVLAGCETNHDLPVANARSNQIPRYASSAIASDMAGRLVERIGAATPVPFAVEGGPLDEAAALQAALEGWGYATATGKPDVRNEQPIKLVYAVGRMDGQVLARLSTPRFALARAYNVTANGALPASPLSVRHLN